MAGAKCPKCEKLTMFETPTGKKCSSCGYTMKVSVGSGKGERCLNCGNYQVFSQYDGSKKCRNCGAIFK